MPFPFHHQLDAMDCGAASLRMVAEFHGRRYSLQELRQRTFLDREGVSARGIVMAAEGIGLRALPVKVPFQVADNQEVGLVDAPLPCIVHWRQNHFVVVYKITKTASGWPTPQGESQVQPRRISAELVQRPAPGVAILLEPTPEFYQQEGDTVNRKGFGFLLSYLRPYRRLTVQLLVGLVVASLIQFLFPFLTQAVVDVGIENQDLGFVWLILFAQLMLFAGQTTVRFLQNWILLHIGTRVNISLVSDFLVRLMSQPISFFDAKMTGDLLQRIGDHRRIEEFMTVSSLNILFSAFNLLIFGGVLAVYNLKIFAVFLVASVLYIAWIFLFLKKRADADLMRFRALSDNQSAIIELIQGMQEIKLQNSEQKRRYGWVHIQARLFRANVRSLSISQWQDAGAQFIAQVKDIVIIAIAAAAVIEGQMSLGMMLATMFILGQLNVPLQQIIGFVRSAQDAKISLERLAEIHGEPLKTKRKEVAVGSIRPLDQNGRWVQSKTLALSLENVSFRYNPLSDFVLKNVNLTIPAGKVTAIVGTSGSGKTTLVKLLLGFYEPSQGTVNAGHFSLKNLPAHDWRSRCGAVMQDGFIFSDTIASNIAESEADWQSIDHAKLLKAVQVAHIQEVIENLPLGYNTMVGAKGNGLSQGQRQRLLIARAVYKEPDYLFFDEATNALDAHTEKIITGNLAAFFQGKTVIVVAHRLSTVKNADQIVVMERGEIVEMGTHEQLSLNKGAYYQLVKEQLELGA
ncbi:MAG: peptidase domain-containing ABC transporter [Saprospiraceae bacterium]|nr:peptidase domain-containing ABC transporter [Saprospiraceae bacterium]